MDWVCDNPRDGAESSGIVTWNQHRRSLMATVGVFLPLASRTPPRRALRLGARRQRWGDVSKLLWRRPVPGAQSPS
jgi:hypothetical protein